MTLLLVCNSRSSCRKDREGLNRKVKNVLVHRSVTRVYHDSERGADSSKETNQGLIVNGLGR